MAKSTRNIQFPFGGLNRRFGLQSQPPYTTPDCLNVVPRNGITRRQVGGSQPRLMAGTYGISPSRFLTSMTSVINTSQIVIEELFKDGSDSFFSWTSLGLCSRPSLIDKELVQTCDGGTYGSMCAGTWTDMNCPVDHIQNRMTEILLHPDPDSGYMTGEYVLGFYDGGAVSLYYSYDSQVSHLYRWLINKGLLATVAFDGSGSMSAMLEVRGINATTGFYETLASYTASNSSDINTCVGWLRLEIDGTTIKIWYDNTIVLSQDIGTVVPGDYHLAWSDMTWPCIGMRARTSGESCYLDGFRYHYHTTSTRQQAVKNLVSYGFFGADGPGILTDKRYRERLEVQTRTLKLSEVLTTAEHLQKLYIADYSDAFNMTGSDTVEFDNVTEHKNYIHIDGMNWSAAGVDKDRHLVYVVTANQARAVKIYRVETTKLYLDADDLTCGACTYQVFVSSKYYDSSANTLNHWIANYGVVPIGCKIVCRYRNRIVLAGSNGMPSIWYMSRSGDPFDWDYFQPDAGRAVCGTNNEAGELGDEITALIPYTDDYLIFGCRNSMWILRGDPACGGQLEPINRQIGIVGPNAWCYGPNGEVVALTTNGLYLFPSGGQSYPAAVSSEMIPDDLRDFGKDDANVSMAYDREYNCVIIATGELSYWFDWDSKTFWPMSPRVEAVTIDGRAYIDFGRLYNRLAGGSGYIKIGPIRLGDDYNENVLTEMIGSLIKNSGPVTWSVHVDDSPETVIDKTGLFSGSWSAGRNPTVRPRARGNYLMIMLSGTSKRPWGLESIVLTVKRGGKIR